MMRTLNETLASPSAAGAGWTACCPSLAGRRCIPGALSYVTGSQGLSGFGSSSTADEVLREADMRGKVVVITGGLGAIGGAAVASMCRRGAHVVAGCRDVEGGREEASAVVGGVGGEITCLHLDTSLVASVRKFAEDFKALGVPLHALINAAAVMACPFGQTREGNELQFATNHLGHFHLTNLLLPALEATAAASGGSWEGRVVNVSCMNHYFCYRGQARTKGVRLRTVNSPQGYSPWLAYGQSKLCNVLHTRALAQRLRARGSPVVATCANPGACLSGLHKHLGYAAGGWQGALVRWGQAAREAVGPGAWKTPEQAAATVVFCAAGGGGAAGAYYADCNISRCSIAGRDDDAAELLWHLSEELVASADATGTSTFGRS